MRRVLIAFAALAFCRSLPGCYAQDQPDTLTGPVTNISANTFDVAGRHIGLSSDAQLCTLSSGKLAVGRCKPRSAFAIADLFLGEQLELSGNDHPVNHSFTAYKVTLQRIPRVISGAAVIDLIPSAQSSNLAARLLRADGYLLRINSDTKLKFEPPLASLGDISTNQWIQYSGALQTDGTILLKSATIQLNQISDTENKMLAKSDYDPAAVAGDAHQSAVKKAFTGIDPKQVPPYHDPAMQARIDRIGNSLIPAYQRSLPDSDPTKIIFRFQLVDGAKWHDAFTTPTGFILVPYQLVERLQDDDQLAAVLADNIAEALEKDPLRVRSLGMESLAGTAAGYAAAALPLGAGLAASAGGLGVSGHAQHVIDAEVARSGRVSLCLLHDAGYDIRQAPLAWWLLAGKKSKPLDEIELPPRAETLYQALGLIWRNSALNNKAPD